MSRSVELRGTSVTSRMPTGVRRSYDSNFKLVVVKHAQKYNNCDASRVFGVSEVNVRRWILMQTKIKNAKTTRKSFSGPKTGRFQEIEDEVVNFVRTQRQSGMAVSIETILLKANETARRFGIPYKVFKGSRGWCTRMMRRNNFSLRRRTSICQKLPKEYDEKLLAYQKFVIQLRKNNNYLLSQIGNADETPVFFDMPYNSTVNERGARSVRVKTTGNEKLRVTVMLAVLADGKKLPPYVILKRKTMPKERLPGGIIVRCQERGWMTTELMKDWLNVVWNRRPGASLKQRGMLSLDAFKGHLTPAIKSLMTDLNTDLVVIPGGMTSQLQVLDVSVNKTFKNNLKKLYCDWLHSGNYSFTPKGNIKKPEIARLCEWIKTSWQQIKPEVIVRGFKKCCLSNSMDGSEDCILWEDSDGSDTDSESGNSVENDNE